MNKRTVSKNLILRKFVSATLVMGSLAGLSACEMTAAERKALHDALGDTEVIRA